MSEYQFYEFKSIDKPLTQTEKETISGWSSRTQATSSGAIFTYHYSDFPKDELKVVEKYFDAMFYISNWGTRRLIFKIPTDFVDKKKMKLFCVEGLEIREYENFILIDIWLEDEEGGYDWVEGDGMLSSFITLRNDIISGDYRCLYLIWLKVSTEDVANGYDNVDADSIEPDVPFGMNELNGSLLEFIDVFCIDKDTIEASATISQPIKNENIDYSSYISKMADREKDNLLLRLLDGEPLLSEKIKRDIGRQKSRPTQIPSRTVQEIVQGSLTLKNERELAEKKKQKEKHIAKLKKIDNEKKNLWEQVSLLISQKKSKAYDEAVQILISLKELAVFKNDLAVFQARVEQIKKQNNNLSGLKSRIDTARLMMK